MNQAELLFPRRRASSRTLLVRYADLAFTGASFIRVATSFAECGCARSSSALRDSEVRLSASQRESWRDRKLSEYISTAGSLALWKIFHRHDHVTILKRHVSRRF